MPLPDLTTFEDAIRNGDATTLRQLLAASSSLREKINSPMFSFGRRPINAAAAHIPALDVLLEFGANINLRSDWEAGPFGVLDECPDDVARHLVSRGATLTAHAAARLGWFDELRGIVDGALHVVHEKGGDGQRPLHFAKTPQIADFLLDRGAEIDALCVDHGSTAAQYALKDRPDVTNRLVERGATPDIFMPARLGRLALAEQLIDADPNCIAARTSIKGYDRVPAEGIYNWVLGFHLSPHEVAMRFGNQDVYDLLYRRSSPKIRLLDAAMRADEPTARSTLRDEPALLKKLQPEDHALLACAAIQNRTDAVKLMLELGFDPMARALDGGSALHMAAWVGNCTMIQELLQRNADLHQLDPTYGASPLSWAAYGSVHRKCEGSDYAAAIELLVRSGADVKIPGNKYGSTMVGMADGNPQIQDLLRRLGAT